MKHTLQLRLSQHLTLTPQLQQSIRLLQLSTLELNQEVERILQENPLLEMEDEGGGADGGAPAPEPVRADSGNGEDTESSGSAPEEAPTDQPREEATSDDWADAGWDDGGGSYGRDDSEESEYPQLPASQPQLREHLMWQINLLNVPDRDRKIISLLVDALDEDGYLTMGLDEICASLPPELEIELQELEIALHHLQNLDPPGVAGRNLSECLALQLKALPEDVPHRNAALAVVRDHLPLLANREFPKLRKLLDCDDDCLRGVQKLIQSLNPRPGSEFGPVDARYIVSDVIVRKVKGMWLANLNPDAMPRLRINRMYAEILQRNRDSSTQQLNSQLQEAKWLIKNVQQRFETILRVSQAIVDRQRRFFEHGEVAMRPLVLREIAEALDLHESTVSRVTTQKFMLTPRGIFELKYFFGSHVSTETGGACSATAIRALIKQMVSAENSKTPLSDSQIADILGQQGIVVARRTIAKYRESLQIPPVNLRKSL